MSFFNSVNFIKYLKGFTTKYIVGIK